MNAFTIGEILGDVGSYSDLELGRKAVKLITYGIAFAFGIACAALLAWWLALLMSLLGGAALGYLGTKVSDDNCAALGVKLGATASKVRGFFTRKG